MKTYNVKTVSRIGLLVATMLISMSVSFAQKIAVLDFKAGAGIRQSDVDGISAVFTTYFSPRGYTIVERNQVDRVLREQNFQGSSLTEYDMVRLGQILNVTKLVVGDVNIVAGQYNVDVRVVDVQGAFVTGRDGVTFPPNSSYRETMKVLAERLASQIAVVTGSTGGTSMSNSPTAITLHGYLVVYPEDLGVFSSDPSMIISALNKNNSYGHNNWRLPTDEELAVMNGSKWKLNMTGTNYMTTENCGYGVDRFVRLVTLADEYAYLNLIISVNGNNYMVLPYDVESYYDVEECNKQRIGGYDDWKEPTMDMLRVMYQRRGIIGGFKSEKYESRDTDEYGYSYGLDFSNGQTCRIGACCKPTRPIRKID